MIIARCWDCGTEYTAGREEIVAGIWMYCPACRERRQAEERAHEETTDERAQHPQVKKRGADGLVRRGGHRQ
jgi:DNA-directed RNA polymerase subunit RPC12/RpoP